jgi:hypothetical protein
MFMRSISTFVFLGATTWLAIKGLNLDIFKDNTFWILACVWGYFGVIGLLGKLEDLKDKNVEDKIDDLTSSIDALTDEIRKDRESRGK